MYQILSKDTIENEIIPHLSVAQRGFKTKNSLTEIVNCILSKLKTGIQWEFLPVGSKLGLSREQVLLILSHYSIPQNIKSLMFKMGVSNRSKFKNKYINPLIEEGLLEMTIPDKPNSSLQKYRLTSQGKKLYNNNEPL